MHFKLSTSSYLLPSSPHKRKAGPAASHRALLLSSSANIVFSAARTRPGGAPIHCCLFPVLRHRSCCHSAHLPGNGWPVLPVKISSHTFLLLQPRSAGLPVFLFTISSRAVIKKPGQWWPGFLSHCLCWQLWMNTIRSFMLIILLDTHGHTTSFRTTIPIRCCGNPGIIRADKSFM